MVIGREGGGREGETRRMREISGARVSNASAASVVSARATTHRKRDIRRLAVARLVRGGTARPLISRRSLLSRAGLRYTGPCFHEQGYPIPVPALTSRATLYRQGGCEDTSRYFGGRGRSTARARKENGVDVSDVFPWWCRGGGFHGRIMAGVRARGQRARGDFLWPKKGADREVRPMIHRGDKGRPYGSPVGTRYCVFR